MFGKESARTATPYALLCFAALTIRTIEPTMVNNGIYVQIGAFFPNGRELATLACVLMYLIVYGFARYKSRFLSPKLLACSGALCAILAGLSLGFGIYTENAAWTFVGMLLRLASDCISVVLVGSALHCLVDTGVGYTVIACSLAASQVIASALPSITGLAGVLVDATILLVSVALPYLPAQSVLTEISKSEPLADLQLSNPNAFISWRSGFYSCMLVFGIAFGIAISLTAEVSLSSWIVAGFVLLAIIAWFLYSKSHTKQDRLFAVAVVLLFLGFAAVASAFTGHIEAAGVFFSCGCLCFSVLVWLVMYSVGRRSTCALLPTLSLVMAFQSLGVLAGAVSGNWLTRQVLENTQMGSQFAVASLVAIFIFLWCFFKSFSFSETIEGLTEIPAEMPIVPASEHEIRSTEELCAAIGGRYALTPREIEVMSLLARGRNVGYIQEKLVITRNTTKSHIRSIYAKLTVHSHQELIDLVEKERTSV